MFIFARDGRVYGSTNTDLEGLRWFCRCDPSSFTSRKSEKICCVRHRSILVRLIPRPTEALRYVPSSPVIKQPKGIYLFQGACPDPLSSEISLRYKQDCPLTFDVIFPSFLQSSHGRDHYSRMYEYTL